MYSALKDNGTYYDSNPYNLSSASRLLVMGREAGNAMPDKGYTFWGDDNASLATYTSPNDSLWHIMKRTWLVKTNVPSSPDTTITRWTGQGLEVSKNGFMDNLTVRQQCLQGICAGTHRVRQNADTAGAQTGGKLSGSQVWNHLERLVP